MTISAINQSVVLSPLTVEGASGLSLDERMIHAIATMANNANHEQQEVLKKLQRPETISDPNELFSLQQRSADYNLQVSKLAILARKGVSTIETLLRS